MLLLAFVWSFVRYRCWGDPIWTVDGGLMDAPDCFGIWGLVFELKSRDGVIRHDPSLIGQLQCAVLSPGGIAGGIGRAGMEFDSGAGRVRGNFPSTPEAGTYTVRWLAARENQQWYEKARGTLKVAPADAQRLEAKNNMVYDRIRAELAARSGAAQAQPGQP